MPGSYDGDAVAADLPYERLWKLAQQAAQNSAIQRLPSPGTPSTVERLNEAAALSPALFYATIPTPLWSGYDPASLAPSIAAAWEGGVPTAIPSGPGELDRLSATNTDKVSLSGPIELGQRPEFAATSISGALAMASRGASPGAAFQGPSGIFQSPLPTPDGSKAESIKAADVGLLTLAQAAGRLADTLASMRLLDRSAGQGSPFATSSTITPALGGVAVSTSQGSDAASIVRLSHAIQSLSVLNTRIDVDLRPLLSIYRILLDLNNGSIPRIILSIGTETQILSEIEKNTHQDFVDKFNKFGGAINTAVGLGGIGWSVYRGLSVARAARIARAAQIADGPAEAVADVGIWSHNRPCVLRGRFAAPQDEVGGRIANSASS